MTAAAQIETAFREEHGRVLAALISQLGDFELAEDALQDALVEALTRWPVDGIPRNPGAWLTAVARRIDPGLAPRIVQQHEGEQATGFGTLRHEHHQHAAQSDRFAT